MARKQKFTALRIGTALAALSAAGSLAAQTAPAETEASDEQQAAAANETLGEEGATQDQEIVVTARRRAESLQDVPIAVTAYSGEALERQGALDITDISDTTPNVTLETSRGTNTTLTAFIRGVGQQDPVAGFEQGVGIYLDDVFLNRPQAAVLDIYDVERIEVLRGPQGTLYGRNTIGGAVKYVTRRLPDDLQLRMRANLGTYDQADLVVSTSHPLGDTVRVGASFARLSRGGFGDNLTTGDENYNRNIYATRGTIELEPSSRAFFRLSGDYTWDESNQRGGHRLIPSFLTKAPVLENEFDTRGGLRDPKQKVKGGGVALHGDIEVTDAITLRSITAYRKDESASPIDFDALPSIDLDVPAIYRNKQFSQELQLLYQQGPFNALLGAYYLKADALTAFDVRLFTTVAGLAASTSSEIDTKTSAVFGDLSFDVTDQLSVSVGARYTWDKRIGDIFRQNYLGGGSALFGGAATPLGTPATDFEGSRDFNKFTPRASVSFEPTEDHTIYASYSQGFKGGGFDPRGVGVNAPDLNNNGTREPEEIAAFIGFAPETVDSYELGYKASLFDRRLNLALAAFRADYKDVQIPGSVPCVVGGIATFCGVTANAGQARFQGFEAETNLILSRDLSGVGDRLNLAGSLGYIDAEYLEYDTFIAGKGTVGVAEFREVQNTPKWTASGTLDYTRPIGGGRLNFNSTVSYRSKTFQFEIPNPFLDQKGYTLWDASLSYSSDDEGWSIGIHGKNLTDKRYKTSGYTFMLADPVTGVLLLDAAGNLRPGTGREGTLTAFYGNPRQVFVTFGLQF
jgi:iron complex outermembrane receptor protein